MEEVVSRKASWERAFSGKRVLVTGDTGFKGSWLALWLHRLGAEVFGYALPPTGHDDHYVVSGLEELIHHFDGDIRDLPHLHATFQQVQPEYLFHLAAQPLVHVSYNEPKSTFDTNVGGSVNVLESARSTPSLKSIIFVTSDKCYRNKEWLWGYREIDELGGRDPYSASKAAAELVFSSYKDSYFDKLEGLGIASVRAGNVIGGGDWSSNRIVPDCIRSLQAGDPVRLRNPGSTRPWQHVLDPLSGYLSLAARLAGSPKNFGGSWNFGPDENDIKTVRQLADTLIKDWGQGTIQEAVDPAALHEAGLLHLNCDKARQLLGWTPHWPFQIAVRETAAWYKSVHAGDRARQVSEAQIEKYMSDSHD